MKAMKARGKAKAKPSMKAMKAVKASKKPAMKAMKAVKASKKPAMKAMKAVKASKKKPAEARKRPAEGPPQAFRLPERHAKVAAKHVSWLPFRLFYTGHDGQERANCEQLEADGTHVCQFGFRTDMTLADVLREASDAGCAPFRYKPIGMAIVVQRDGLRSDNDTKSNDDRKPDDDTKRDDDRKPDDDSGNSDRSGTSSSHYGGDPYFRDQDDDQGKDDDKTRDDDRGKDDDRDMPSDADQPPMGAYTFVCPDDFGTD